MIKKIVLPVLLFCSLCFGYSPAITSFSTGQTSPFMEARSDFAKYSSSCRILENMLPLAQGPVIRRPGTKYISTTKSGSAILIPFEYSTDDTYILEFGDNYVRFYRNGAQVLSGSSPYEIATVFDSAELPNLRYAQSNNTMYIIDGNDPIQILRRITPTSWTITDANVTTGPFRADNVEDVNITPSGIDEGNTITLEATGDIFVAGHVGALWKIRQERVSSTLSGTFDANGVSVSSAYFVGDYSFVTSGQWWGTVTLQRSTNGGITWDNALVPTPDTNYDNPSETEADGAVYRVTFTDANTPEAGTVNYTLTIGNTLQNGIVKITAVTDANTATATVISELASTNATSVWAEGYWSDYRGWPNTITFHQQRLVLGGSESFPQTIWFGRANPDDAANFTEGTLDTSAFTIALPGQNPIQWILSGDYLFLGTSGSVGKYGEQGKAITPTSPNYNEQSKVGSTTLNAVFANDSILYVERGNRNVREFAYNLQSDSYKAPDLTVLSQDITLSGIKDVAFQSRPNPILWCVLNNGKMATFTFIRDQEILSWASQVTDGYFESVAVIPSSSEDEVWVEVKRTINGTPAYYVEQFQPNDWGEDQNDCFFVDCGFTYSGASTTSLSGLLPLKGETVSVYADGIVLPDVTVSATGTTTIDNSAENVIIGLPYTSILETMPITINAQDKAMNKAIKSIDFDLYKTGYCEYGFGKSSTLIPMNFWSNFTTARQDLYSSDESFFNVGFPFGSKKKATIYLKTDRPLPLCVRSIIPNFEISK